MGYALSGKTTQINVNSSSSCHCIFKEIQLVCWQSVSFKMSVHFNLHYACTPFEIEWFRQNVIKRMENDNLMQ